MEHAALGPEVRLGFLPSRLKTWPYDSVGSGAKTPKPQSQGTPCLLDMGNVLLSKP